MSPRERAVKLTVRLSPRLLQWARGEARRQERSLNAFIVRTLSRRRETIIKARTARASSDDVLSVP